MHQTPWTNNASSLPSDRIPPAHKQPAGGDAPKAKGKQREVPKSKEVKGLEELRDGLAHSAAVARDPNGGCFCLARVHALSPYTPICRQCGLTLCSLNRPQFACPHCTAPLLNTTAREALVTSLETQIHDTLAKEERSRQEAVENARKAAGAFPTLSGAPPVLAHAAAGPLASHPVNQTHKVLSLNSKTRKIKVESRRTLPAQAASPAPSSDAENQIVEKVPPRIPHPPHDVVIPPKPPVSERLWARLDNVNVLYTPPPKAAGQKNAKTTGKGKNRVPAGDHGNGRSSSGRGAKNNPV